MLTLAAVAGALIGYRLERRGLYGACKTAASAGFVWLALTGWPPGERWGWLLLAGLGLSFLGDVVLIGTSKSAFAGGMALFFGVHVAYLAAFLTIGPKIPVLVLALVALAAVAVTVRRALSDRLARGLAAALNTYIALLVLSVATGIASAWTMDSVALGMGIALVGLSDTAVVRERFIRAGFGNKIVGLSAYYAGQLLIASVLLMPG